MGTMGYRVTARSMIVPLQAFVDVTCDAYLVSCGVSVTTPLLSMTN